jgi:hypothetical protein
MMYWVALAIWLAVLVAAGVAATSTFTTLPDPALGLTLEPFANYDHAEHGRIAAGKVMEPIFTFVDLMQVVTGAIVVLMLVLQLTLFKVPMRIFSNLLRMACIAAAIGLVAWRAFTLTPEMNSDLRQYWTAAEAGHVEQAKQHRAAFDANHGKASAMFRWTFLAVLVAIGASAATLGPRPEPAGSPLERPKLAL